MKDAKALAEVLGAVLDGEGSDAVLTVRQAAARAALERLKAEGFNVLVDLTAVDYLRFPEGPVPRAQRFKLTYRLMALDPETGLLEGRLALCCWVEGSGGPPSVKDLWPCADWLEREVWDMFGIAPPDRPGIQRLLLYEEFSGHPLRKDYPINKRQPLIGPQDEKPRERMTAGDLRPRMAP